jgi:transposase
MQASTASTPITDHNSTIFVAIELSQKTWLVTLHSPDKDKISRHKLDGGDHAGLLALIKSGARSGGAEAGSGPRGGELLRGWL